MFAARVLGTVGAADPARRRTLRFLLVLLVAATGVVVPSARAAATLPAGFSDQFVAAVQSPVALAWTPDGRMLINSKEGALRIYENGALLPDPALDLSSVICADSERGLLGVAVDPDFTSNHYVYLYYTFKKHGVCESRTPNIPVNRVSRFVLNDDDTVDIASETVLIDNIYSVDGIHNAGDIDFGNDGNLYVSVGDNGCDWRWQTSTCYLNNDASRDLSILAGKILRIAPDGSIPSGNPFTGPDSDQCNVSGSTAPDRRCREIYASGLRNPWRTAFDSDAAGTRFFINDVGAGKWEEVNEGAAGADYGWNVREGPCVADSYTDCGLPPVGITNPIYSYPHTNPDGCTSVTAGDFVPDGFWPPGYDDVYIYGDSVCGKLYTLIPDGSGGYSSQLFGSEADALVDGRFGPDGSSKAFYYLQFTFPSNQIRKISHTGTGNIPPNAVATANPSSGNTPLTVSFDGSSSSDADLDPLTYDWDFGDGSPHGSGSTPSHTYTVAGTYTATLTVSDGRGGEDSVTLRIDSGNTVPTPTIDAPAVDELFSVGETLTLTGSATDPEDGTLPDSALSWTVLRRHNTHTHPYLPATQGNNVEITGPPPEDLEAAGNSYLEVYLTATDSEGLSQTVQRNVQPKKVDLTFQSVPDYFQLRVAGSLITTPRTIVAWENWAVDVEAFDQVVAGRYWVFDGWSDGGTQEHTITTPASPATYTASFKVLAYPRPGGAALARVPLVPEFASCDSPNSFHAPPLDEGSCTPPQLESQLLTTSTSGRGTAFARFDVLRGDPATPANEADVSISASVTDVRQNIVELLDYEGKLVLRTDLRITDSANGADEIMPATVGDLGFSAPFDCLATPAPNRGATCDMSTTLNAIVPGFVQEGKRAVVSTYSILALDPGPDGVLTPASDPLGYGCPPTCGSGDERVFLRQGVFTP